MNNSYYLTGAKKSDEKSQPVEFENFWTLGSESALKDDEDLKFARQAFAEEEPATMGELQITGLHTSNPLIMYNGQLLSCHWTSTIGTDMFFTKPQANGADSHQPLRSLPS
ncbi:MAG: hypothetical protein EOO43_05445, partial [Flavobacterium sp.]